MNIDCFGRWEPIRKGWSGDQKYRVTDTTGVSYFLRLSALERYEKQKNEFRMMQSLWALGIPMPEPIAFGICDEGVYSLHGWIEGTVLEEQVGALPVSEQRKYGLAAGCILKDIHSLPAPDETEDWESRFNRKADAKIKAYRECPLKFAGGEAFVEYIEQNRKLLKGRPQAYQHGDYHAGNMMLDGAGKLYIIDFDRDDYGDPWEEFNRITWCVQASPVLAAGMVDGYFGGEPPELFWRLLAFYIASNTLSHLPWAMSFGTEEIEVATRLAEGVLQWYNGMRNVIPTWYKNNL